MIDETHEGWKNRETWELALFIDNYSKEILDRVIAAAHEASRMQRHPVLSFQVRMARIIDLLPGCPLWRHQPIFFGEIYDHYLAKDKERHNYELKIAEEERRAQAAVPTECELCHRIVPRGSMLYHEVAEYPDEQGNAISRLFCRTCFEGDLFRCDRCGQCRVDVKAGKEYYDDVAMRWDAHQHTFSETRAFFKQHPRLKDPEKLCEPCFNKKHHLAVVTLIF